MSSVTLIPRSENPDKEDHSAPIATVPVNGQPVTLVEQIDHEALAYRELGDSFSQFIASHLERLAQLVLWTDAKTPEEHEGRMEVWDDEIRDKFYDRGFEDGLQTARNEYGLLHNFPID
jgi:hypothetical protein